MDIKPTPPNPESKRSKLKQHLAWLLSSGKITQQEHAARIERMDSSNVGKGSRIRRKRARLKKLLEAKQITESDYRHYIAELDRGELPRIQPSEWKPGQQHFSKNDPAWPKSNPPSVKPD